MRQGLDLRGGVTDEFWESISQDRLGERMGPPRAPFIRVRSSSLNSAAPSVVRLKKWLGVRRRARNRLAAPGRAYGTCRSGSG